MGVNDVWPSLPLRDSKVTISTPMYTILYQNKCSMSRGRIKTHLFTWWAGIWYNEHVVLGALSIHVRFGKGDPKMKDRRLFLALLLGLGLTLIGLFALGGLTAPLQQPADPTPSPAMNAHTAPRDSAVSIAYNEGINPATVSTSTFAVHAMQTGLLTQTYSVNGGTITLTPLELFKPGELVQATATTGTLNLLGQGPISPTVWQFRAAVGGGAGKLTDSLQSTVQFAGFAIDVGDVNGDGSLDIYAANTGFMRVDEVWLNNGVGDFTSSGWTLGGSFSQDIALGDLNGDGRLDAFIVNAGEPDEVWINVGPGGFVQRTLGADEVSLGVALGDVDGDGDLDAFVVNNGSQANQLWLNDGSGSFTNSAQSLGSADAEDVALGDLDGDGDLDAFVVNDLAPDELYENNGRGGFSLEKTLGTSTQSFAVALGDVDGNGKLDAVVANESSGEANTLWINDGGWTFAMSTQTLGQAVSRDVALGDLDGDGDLDLVIANDETTDDAVWLNDGGLQGGTQGSFTQQPGLAVQNTEAVELGDLDGDGDLDVVLCAGDTYNVIWFNVTHKVYLPLVVRNYP
jgi:hypothetical protein